MAEPKGKRKAGDNRVEEVWRGYVSDPPPPLILPMSPDAVDRRRLDRNNRGAHPHEMPSEPDRSPEGEANEFALLPVGDHPTWVRQHKDFTKRMRDELLRQLAEEG